MGNGVPNQGPFKHWQGSAAVDVVFRYHDQQVTGSAWPESLPVTISGYTTIRNAALQSRAAFDAAVAASAWDAFFKLYTGINKTAARQGCIDLLP